MFERQRYFRFFVTQNKLSERRGISVPMQISPLGNQRQTVWWMPKEATFKGVF